MLLTHFGDRSFTREHCRGTCDNCEASEGQEIAMQDASDAARKGAHARTPPPGAAGRGTLP